LVLAAGGSTGCSADPGGLVGESPDGGIAAKIEPFENKTIMQVPPEIAYHHLTKSEAIDALIRGKIEHLEHFCHSITSCQIVVERPHRSERSGNPYRVRIDLHVPPGHELVAVAGGEHNEMHDPLQTVVIDAFEKASRQLKQLRDRQRGDTKTHEEPIALASLPSNVT
jgi:ribosome-associated translation inhibitor RaiA